MHHYNSLNDYLRRRFGCKVYKLALDGGFTCPNRDGTLDTRGCIFCSGRGSGDFAADISGGIDAAVEKAKKLVAAKNPGGKYIAYFQNFTGTYAPAERLRRMYEPLIARDDIAAVSVATRPDCLPGDVMEVLADVNRIKPVWIELGLQTIHSETARYIRRGYPLSAYDSAVCRLKEAGIEVITHMIIGLPGETDEMIYRTADHIGRSGADGVKFQLLHVLRNTDLAADYLDGKFSELSMDEYIRLLEGCVQRISPEMIVHRLTGDGAKRDLIAPLWSADKKRVLNAVNAAFERDGIVQGNLYRRNT